MLLKPAGLGALGLATELCPAAINAAPTRSDRPVIAFLLENNVASTATAQRAGLRRVWCGPHVGNPTRPRSGSSTPTASSTTLAWRRSPR